MRILNIIASLDPRHGGPIDGTLRLAQMWGAMGHHVAVATLDAADADYLPDDLDVFALGEHRGAPVGGAIGRFVRRFNYAPRMVPWLRAHVADYDVVLVHALWNYSTVAARRVLVDAGIPFFVMPHGSLDPWFRRTYPTKHLAKRLLWPLSEGRLANAADGVLFTTDEEQRLAHAMFRPWAVTPRVIGFGSADVPDDETAQRTAFHDAYPALRDRRFLLFLSRIHPKKGCDLLIDAFAERAARCPDLSLVFAGPDQIGWRSELEERAAAAGIEDRVHWTGMIEGAVKWGAFRACDAFVLPSHSENFGVVVAEALACARPVMITDKVNLWREVDACGAGIVEPDTLDGVGALLDRFSAMDAPSLDRMSGAARICYDRHFRFEAAATRMIALFAEAVAR